MKPAVIVSSFSSSEVVTLDVPGLMSQIVAGQPPGAPQPTSDEVNAVLNAMIAAQDMNNLSSSGTTVSTGDIDVLVLPEIPDTPDPSKEEI